MDGADPLSPLFFPLALLYLFSPHVFMLYLIIFLRQIFLKCEMYAEKASRGVRQPKTLRGMLLISAAILSSCF
jgi:hypothetical protein